MQTERRRQRSNHLPEALRLYLESLAHSHNLQAAALATREGDLVTGTGDPASVNDLAVLGALEIDRPGAANDLAPDLAPGRNFHVASLDVDGYPLRLASLGAAGPTSAEVGPAVKRILFATA